MRSLLWFSLALSMAGVACSDESEAAVPTWEAGPASGGGGVGGAGGAAPQAIEWQPCDAYRDSRPRKRRRSRRPGARWWRFRCCGRTPAAQHRGLR